MLCNSPHPCLRHCFGRQANPLLAGEGEVKDKRYSPPLLHVETGDEANNIYIARNFGSMSFVMGEKQY